VNRISECIRLLAGKIKATKRQRPPLRNWRPSLLVLEDRTVPSTLSSGSQTSEDTIIKGANFDTTSGYFDVYYSDEHAMALGVGTVQIKTLFGTSTTNYPIAPLTSDPGSATNPALGTTATSGNQAGTDASGLPIAPYLFITDISNNSNSHSGDWQSGGRPYAPSDVFGTWKSVTRTVDYTLLIPMVSLKAAADPVANGWNLGPGADPVPAGFQNDGYGTEIRWSLSDLAKQGVLIPGHQYRFAVMVHDGDQNGAGGDVGQAAFNVTYTPPPVTASLSGYVFVDNAGTGVYQSGDSGVEGATVTITGTDNSGHSVSLTTTTDVNGQFTFTGLSAGTYALSHTIAGNMADGPASAGTDNGTTDGTVSGSSIISIVLNPGDQAIGYGFAEYPMA
jgi:hypothetical protein